MASGKEALWNATYKQPESFILPSLDEVREVREAKPLKAPITNLEELLLAGIEVLEDPNQPSILMLIVPQQEGYRLRNNGGHRIVLHLPQHEIAQATALFREAGYFVDWDDAGQDPLMITRISLYDLRDEKG